MSDVIIISGKMGSGKTTLMEELKKGLIGAGLQPINVIFADTIYKIHDFAINLLKDRGIERDIVKDGKLLQLLGTEWGRNSISENIWVDCLKGEIEQHEADGETNLAFLVSDCRFQNEFDGFPNTFSVRLEASKEVRKARCSQWRENDTHASEIDLDIYAAQKKFTVYIDTEGDKEESMKKLSAALLLWKLDNTAKGMGYEEVAKKYYV